MTGNERFVVDALITSWCPHLHYSYYYTGPVLSISKALSPEASQTELTFYHIQSEDSRGNVPCCFKSVYFSVTFCRKIVDY